MMKEIGTGRGSETECMASELGVQLTVSAAELEEQKKLVLDRDQTIASLKAEVSRLQQMHLPIEPWTMVQNPAELRERANQSHDTASARTPASASASEVECPATDEPSKKQVKLRDFFGEEVRLISREPPARLRVHYYINWSIKIKI